MMSLWAWHYLHSCHAHFTEGSATLKHGTKTVAKNQNFSKILFACFHMMPEASERYVYETFSICNIKEDEKFPGAFKSIYFQVFLAELSKNFDFMNRMTNQARRNRGDSGDTSPQLFGNFLPFPKL